MPFQVICGTFPGFRLTNLGHLGMTGRSGLDLLLLPPKSVPASKWKAQEIVNSFVRLSVSRIATLTEDLIDSYITPKTISRNARLALLKFYAEKTSGQNDSSVHEYVEENLFSACFGYFSDYSTKAVCFHDLRPYVSRLSRRCQEQFLILIARDCRSRRPRPKDPDVSCPCMAALHWLS